MLTPSQLTQLKANTTTTGTPAVAPTQAMTPEQAHAWIGGTTPPAGNNALSTLKDFGGSIIDTAKAGAQNVASGLHDVFTAPQTDPNAVREAAQGGGPIAGAYEAGAQALKGGEHAVAGLGKVVGGALQTVTSPVLGPATKLGSIIGQKLADQIPTDKAMQFESFLEKHPEIGNNSTEIMNLANLAFPDVVKTAAPAVDTGISTAKNAISNVKEALTPEPTKPASPADVAAKTQADQLKAHDIIDKEIRNLGEKYTTVGDALNKAEVSRGTDPIKVLTSYPEGKALPVMNKAGKMSTLPAINFLKNQVGVLGKIKENIVKTSGENTSIEDFKQAALDRIDRSSSSVAKRNADKAGVSGIINNLKGDYPDGIPTSELDKLKTEHANESKSYNSKSTFSPDAHAIVGQTAADAVVSKPGGEIADELNKVMSSHYDAMKVLKAMNGKTPHGGLLTKHAANIAGEVGGLAAGMAVGHPFLGAMAGRGASEAVTNIMNSHFISNPLKRTLIQNMKGEKPEVIQQALDYLDKTIQTDAPSKDLQNNTPNTQQPGEGNPSANTTTKDTPAQVVEPSPKANVSESSSNSSIGNKPTPATTRAPKPLNSGFAKIGNTKPPQEALNTMSDFTDYVAGSYKLKGEAASSIEQEAADLYDKYIGGKAPKTLQGLANAFGKVLEKNNFGKGQGRDEQGRFSTK